MTFRRRPWGILDRFIIKELKGPFFFGVLAFTVLLVAGDLLFKLADLIIEQGVPLNVIVRLFLYSLPAVVVLTLPMAALLSTLLTFARLSSTSEIGAFRASGISFQRIIRPVLVASVAVALMATLMGETLVPLTSRAAENVLRYEVAKQRISLVKDHVFLREEEEGRLKRVVYISRLKPRSGTMEGVLLQEFEEGRLRQILSAERGAWVEGEWWLDDGKVFDVEPSGKVSLLFRFQRQKLTLRLAPEQLERVSRKPEEMNVPELLEQIALVDQQGVDVRSLWVMFHLRLAVPWASVVLALVGAALGVRPQRSGSGSGVGLGLSVVIVFAYYVIMSFCQSLGQGGYLPPVVAAWSPNVIFLVAGGALVSRANR